MKVKYGMTYDSNISGNYVSYLRLFLSCRLVLTHTIELSQQTTIASLNSPSSPSLSSPLTTPSTPPTTLPQYTKQFSRSTSLHKTHLSHLSSLLITCSTPVLPITHHSLSPCLYIHLFLTQSLSTFTSYPSLKSSPSLILSTRIHSPIPTQCTSFFHHSSSPSSHSPISTHHLFRHHHSPSPISSANSLSTLMRGSTCFSRPLSSQSSEHLLPTRVFLTRPMMACDAASRSCPVRVT